MNRLRSYRDIEGISQEELGKLLGISSQMVSAIESGRRFFSGDLTAIGYSNDRFEIPDMSEPLHRQRASTTMTSRKRARELMRLAGEVFGELRNRTEGAPRTAIERLPAPTTPEELEECVAEVRFLLRQEASGPIRNLTAAIERAGVCIVPIVGLDGIDGLSSWVGDVPVIGISVTIPGDRFRLTLGHELAHLLIHVKPGTDIEAEANRFAGILLFPSTEFDEQIPERPQLRDFVNLKSSWGVSAAALVYRAHEFDYIDDDRYRALQIQMSKWRKAEPASFAIVPGELTKRLVAANGGSREVAKSIGVNQRHLVELCNWSHLRAA